MLLFLNFAVLWEVTLSSVQDLAALVTVYTVSNILASPPQNLRALKLAIDRWNGYKAVAPKGIFIPSLKVQRHLPGLCKMLEL